MASAKKKLDEYHLKILRQLVNLPANKECFDCHQRGPTYVNVTLGSFVCTSCSGMLRGLTPPHRVKSISMSSFAPEEIDLVKIRGNEECRKIWLGLADNLLPPKDEQQIKDRMIQVYEKKSFYLDPAIASTIHKTANNGSSPLSNKSSLSESGHASTSLKTKRVTNAVPPLTLAFKAPPSRPQPSQANGSDVFTPEPEFADFSKLSIPTPTDPFNSSQSAAVPFADFDNNPVFSNSSSTGLPGIGEAATVPGEDRYAALKDLDFQMKSQQQVPEQANEWSAGGSKSTTNVWPSQPVFPEIPVQANETNVPSNPFKDGVWSNGNSDANPFRNTRLSSTQEGIWSCANGQITNGQTTNGQMTNGFTTSQSLNFSTNKLPWKNEIVGNPFTAGSSSQSAIHHSSNPFL